VGGGLLLLIISINDLVRPDEVIQRRSSEHIGVVPIGIPLILGPAALTTLLVNSESLGFRVTFLALLFNLIIVWTVLMNSHLVLRILKAGGIKAIAKVAALFLAAIGVRMIRSGLTELKIF
jgi:multiple antibiotic resistance protein